MSNQRPVPDWLPPFAQSSAVDLLVIGVVVGVTVLLAVHLIFTLQYHYPLSHVNYVLQLSSTLMFLINMAARSGVMLRHFHNSGRQWPYAFPYTMPPIPLPSWNVVQTVFFLILQAISTFLVHFTHIQFLTLLFPSELEVRLIFWMLGPLALIEAGVLFMGVVSTENVKVHDLADSIGSVCASSLALLYTTSLFVWGVVVNWRRAWRLDGGTAAFGAAALTLALCNTVISFLRIAFDRIWWLHMFTWSLTIWQSWVGFWWWVSAGMGIGEVEDRERREERIRARRERRQNRRLRRAASAGQPGSEGTSSSVRRFLGLASRRGAAPEPAETDATGVRISEGSSQSTTMDASSETAWNVRFGRFLERHQPRIVRERIRALGRAHERAARVVATKQAAAYNQVVGRPDNPLGGLIYQLTMNGLSGEPAQSRIARRAVSGWPFPTVREGAQDAPPRAVRDTSDESLSPRQIEDSDESLPKAAPPIHVSGDSDGEEWIDMDERPGRTEPAQPRWLLQRGLDRVRLQDRTRYD